MEPKQIDYFGGRRVYDKESVDELLNEQLAEKQDLLCFKVMPPANENVNRCVQFIGVSDLNYKYGFFYRSDGIKWRQVNVTDALVICEELPEWDEARSDVLYYVVPERMLYIKNPRYRSKWFTPTIGGPTDFNNLEFTPTINGIATAGEVGETHDVKLEATVNGAKTAVNELELEELSAADITSMFGEA